MNEELQSTNEELQMVNDELQRRSEELNQTVRICLSGEPSSSSKIVVDAINRRGRSIRCRVTCTPLIGSQGEIDGVILVMEEQEEEP